jgi:hypothetical protein
MHDNKFSQVHTNTKTKDEKKLKTVTKSRDCEEVQPEAAPPDGVFPKLR